MKRTVLLWALAGGILLVAVAAGAGVVVGADATETTPAQQDEDDFPRAEAGLDQTVQRNASVLLDATESHAPSGEIVDYSWHVTTPSGGAIYPDCDSADCGQARFDATELGEYEVMVAVEDEQGRRETDTMYVTVVPRGEFGVELKGPANRTEEEANLTATISPGDAQVQNLTWYRGNRELTNHSVPTTGGIFEHSTYVVPGATYRVVAADEFNRTVEDTWTAPGGSQWSPSGPSSDRYPRIEGPAVVTGPPDEKTDDGWKYSGAEYTVVTSSRGSVTDSVWGLNNGDAEDYGASDTQLEPPLKPGVNTIVANLDLEADRASQMDDPGNSTQSNLDYANGTAEEQVVLQRRVVVDPKPEITSSTIRTNNRQLEISFRSQDPYNSEETVRVIIDDKTVLENSISKTDEYIKTPVPDDVHGDATVRLEVEDGRSQVTTKSKGIHAEIIPSLIDGSIRREFYPPSNDDESSGTHTSPPGTPRP